MMYRYITVQLYWIAPVNFIRPQIYKSQCNQACNIQRSMLYLWHVCSVDRR